MRNSPQRGEEVVRPASPPPPEPIVWVELHDRLLPGSSASGYLVKPTPDLIGSIPRYDAVLSGGLPSATVQDPAHACYGLRGDRLPCRRLASGAYEALGSGPPIRRGVVESMSQGGSGGMGWQAKIETVSLRRSEDNEPVTLTPLVEFVPPDWMEALPNDKRLRYGAIIRLVAVILANDGGSLVWYLDSYNPADLVAW